MNEKNLFDGVDTLQLVDRYNSLVEKYVQLSIELADKLEKFGKYKKELELLSVEFSKRNHTLEDKNDLKKILEEEISKRK